MKGNRQGLVHADSPGTGTKQPGIVVQVMPCPFQQRLVRRRQLGQCGMLRLDRQQRRARHRPDRNSKRGNRHHDQQHERRYRHRETPTAAPRGIVENGGAVHGIPVLG
ncbi:hypothetical protein D9M73_123010 [compost metagenome]